MMKNYIFLLITGICISICNSTQAQEWAIQGNYAESCSCAPAIPDGKGPSLFHLQGDYAESCSCGPVCPCTFGSDPTLGHCHTIMLVQIDKGHYGNVNLDGIEAVIVSRLDDWARVYVSDQVSDKQAMAARNLIFQTTYFNRIGELDWKSTEKIQITVERTLKKVEFSTPYSMVAIERMDGPDGKPIMIKKLGRPDYIQYKSRKINFDGKEEDFQYSGTSGYTSTLNKSSEEISHEISR